MQSMPDMTKCTCPWLDPKYWTTHFGAVEPGSAREWDPDCPIHRKRHAGECCWHDMRGEAVCCGCVHARYKAETA